ncbi:MAG: hypothetical protein R3B47_10515 [Bacteroidia bacterium]
MPVWPMMAVQTSAKMLARLPFGLGDVIGAQIRRVFFGNLRKYNIPLSDVPPMVQVRTTGKTPVIDLGTVAQIKAGNIKVVGDIVRFRAEGTLHSSGAELDIDSVILATGYQAGLTDFIKHIEPELDDRGLPKKPVSDLGGLYFVGFDDYSVGGLLGVIQEESKTVVEAILQSNKVDGQI